MAKFTSERNWRGQTTVRTDKQRLVSQRNWAFRKLKYAELIACGVMPFHRRNMVKVFFMKCRAAVHADYLSQVKS